MCVVCCAHADHDAGTFQKILCEKRIVVMTTKTIYESFIRKYSALSGIDDNFLKRSHKVRIASAQLHRELAQPHCGNIKLYTYIYIYIYFSSG